MNPALEGDPVPLGDLESFHIECVLADLEIVERRLERAKKERAEAQEVAAFDVMKSTLEAERPLRVLVVEELNHDYLRGHGLLTDRPLLVALNRGETEAGKPLPEGIAARLEELDAAGMVLWASVEAEIAGLEPEDQAAFLEDLGLAEPALARFIADGGAGTAAATADPSARPQKPGPLPPIVAMIEMEKDPAEMVAALKPVDQAVMGREGNMLDIVVEEIKPHIIVLGYDQELFEPKALEAKLAERGHVAQVVRLPKLEHGLAGTRKIVARILRDFGQE